MIDRKLIINGSVEAGIANNIKLITIFRISRKLSLVVSIPFLKDNLTPVCSTIECIILSEVVLTIKIPPSINSIMRIKLSPLLYVIKFP